MLNPDPAKSFPGRQGAEQGGKTIAARQSGQSRRGMPQLARENQTPPVDGRKRLPPWRRGIQLQGDKSASGLPPYFTDGQARMARLLRQFLRAFFFETGAAVGDQMSHVGLK